MITIGINGFGRIGRCTLAHIAESARNDVQVVAINATGPVVKSPAVMELLAKAGLTPAEKTVELRGISDSVVIYEIP